MSDRKKKVVQLFKSARSKKKNGGPGPAPPNSQTIIGNHNVQVAGDVIVQDKVKRQK